MTRSQIELILIQIGTPVALNGYTYLVDAVMLLDKPEWIHPKWSALYDCVGNLNNVSGKAVEKGIRKALETTRTNCADYNAIEHYIGFCNCSNSNSLMQLHRMIKNEFESDDDPSYLKDMIRKAFYEMIRERA